MTAQSRTGASQNWLTALLRELLLPLRTGRHDDVPLPVRPSPAMEPSPQILSVGSEGFRHHEPVRQGVVSELTLVATEHFRSDPLRRRRLR